MTSDDSNNKHKHGARLTSTTSRAGWLKTSVRTHTDCYQRAFKWATLPLVAVSLPARSLVLLAPVSVPSSPAQAQAQDQIRFISLPIHLFSPCKWFPALSSSIRRCCCRKANTFQREPKAHFQSELSLNLLACCSPLDWLRREKSESNQIAWWALSYPLIFAR